MSVNIPDMGHNPSAKSHRLRPPEELNIVPLIDVVTILLFFLLAFIAFAPLVIIDAPLPKVATTADEIRKAKEIKDQFDVVLWINNDGFVLKAGTMGTVTLNKPGNGDYPYKELHAQLVKAKGIRPDAKEITMVPGDDIVYDIMIQTMDAARDLQPGEPGFKAVPPEIAQKPESMQFNQLFPDVTIGGV